MDWEVLKFLLDLKYELELQSEYKDEVLYSKLIDLIAKYYK